MVCEQQREESWTFVSLKRESFDNSRDDALEIFRGSADMVSEILNLRCLYVEDHNSNVSRLAVEIGRELNLDRLSIAIVEMAGKVHDTGMFSLYADLISKPGPLKAFEMDLVKEHPIVGANITKTAPFPAGVTRAILEHHERLDGSGYPSGIEEPEISLEGRILAVAEVVSAMSFFRPYRELHGVESALDEIRKYSGILYDREVVKACFRAFEMGFDFKESRSNRKSLR